MDDFRRRDWRTIVWNTDSERERERERIERTRSSVWRDRKWDRPRRSFFSHTNGRVHWKIPYSSASSSKKGTKKIERRQIVTRDVRRRRKLRPRQQWETDDDVRRIDLDNTDRKWDRGSDQTEAFATVRSNQLEFQTRDETSVLKRFNGKRGKTKNKYVCWTKLKFHGCVRANGHRHTYTGTVFFEVSTEGIPKLKK